MVAKRTPGELKPSCSEDTYKVGWEDLPLSCPAPWMKIWDAHPRVYLAVHRTGEAMCEYCGAKFELSDPEPGQPMPHFDNTELEDAFRRAQEAVRNAGSTTTG